MCAFKKEKSGVKVYTVKGGRIPDPKGSGTGLPVARVGEAVIQAPMEQVGVVWRKGGWVHGGKRGQSEWGERVSGGKGCVEG